ncbi:MAG: hypothetical protein DRN96_02310 [Thermoproteota archaeon]|nr:MAG: hypothetical protein DRN96_02310 [Candidatus Korarchaeota archaeon]
MVCSLKVGRVKRKLSLNVSSVAEVEKVIEILRKRAKRGEFRVKYRGRKVEIVYDSRMVDSEVEWRIKEAVRDFIGIYKPRGGLRRYPYWWVQEKAGRATIAAIIEAIRSEGHKVFNSKEEQAVYSDIGVEEMERLAMEFGEAYRIALKLVRTRYISTLLALCTLKTGIHPEDILEECLEQGILREVEGGYQLATSPQQMIEHIVRGAKSEGK